VGLGSNQGLFSPLDPIEAQVSVCLLRTKDSTAIGVKSWILFVSLRFVARWQCRLVLFLRFGNSLPLVDWKQVSPKSDGSRGARRRGVADHGSPPFTMNATVIK